MDETKLLEITIRAAQYPDPEIRKTIGALVSEVCRQRQEILANNQHIDQIEKALLEYDRGEMKW